MSMSNQPGSARRLFVCGLLTVVIGAHPPARAQQNPPPGEMETRPKPALAAPADRAAGEEAREQRSMERFLSLLQKNPRRGTALDRVYGYHVERGSLDPFTKGYHDRLAKDPKDGSS